MTPLRLSPYVLTDMSNVTETVKYRSGISAAMTLVMRISRQESNLQTPVHSLRSKARKPFAGGERGPIFKVDDLALDVDAKPEISRTWKTLLLIS